LPEKICPIRLPQLVLQPVHYRRKGLRRLAHVAAGGPYLRLYPHLEIFPGLLIMLAVLGFNAMGDAIRDILDPRMLNRVCGGRTT